MCELLSVDPRPRGAREGGMRPRSGARVDYTRRVDTARLNRLPKTNEKPTFFDRLDPVWARLDLARLGLARLGLARLGLARLGSAGPALETY